jgi:hypothetical protein
MIKSTLSVAHAVVSLSQSKNYCLIVVKQHKCFRVVLHRFFVLSFAVKALSKFFEELKVVGYD